MIAEAGGWQQVHIALALAIAVAYAAVPFTAVRRLPLTRPTKVFALLFFGTCAITHLGIAAGFHDHPLMLLNDSVQLVAVIGFVRCLSRQVAFALQRRTLLHEPPPQPLPHEHQPRAGDGR